MSVTGFLSGVQHDFNPVLLGDNWAVCYTARYNTYLNSAIMDSILNKCNGSKLLLSCRMVGAPNLKIAAMGDRADVLYDCGDAQTCSHVANGVAWYFSKEFSWGFAKAGDAVDRAQCDFGAGGDDSSRLCWHTGLSAGGFRCGEAAFLNTDQTWERVIYHLP